MTGSPLSAGSMGEYLPPTSAIAGRLPEPYYDDGLCRIYLGDNLDIMNRAVSFGVDLIVTSPPYNLGVSAGGGFGHYTDEAGMRKRGGGGKWTGGALAHGYADHDDAMPMPEYEAWQREVLLACWAQLDGQGAIFFNHKPRVQAGTLWTPFRLVPEGVAIRQVVIWRRAGGVNFAPTHYLPTHEWIVVMAQPGWRLKSKGASGVGDVWEIAQESNTLHPCPFPVGLPARAIETAGPRLVLDPWMGSGTTLVAAKAAGVPSIGIEKSERYCELAVKRLAQGALAFASTEVESA